MFDIFLLPSKECCYMLCLDFFLDYCSFYYFLSNLLQKENDLAPKKEWACAKPYIEVLFLVFSFFFFCVSVLLLIELYLLTNLKLLIPQQTQNYRICFYRKRFFHITYFKSSIYIHFLCFKCKRHCFAFYVYQRM